MPENRVFFCIFVFDLMIGMSIFYSIAGIVIGIMALIMITIRSFPGKEGRRFNFAKRYLTAILVLTSLSMFAARLEVRLEYGDFEELSVAMLLFYFFVGQGFAFSMLTLYASPYASKKYAMRVLLPVVPLFIVYGVMILLKGDICVYSLQEFLALLPNDPRIVMRCVILVAVLVSLSYSLVLCNRARVRYNRMIQSYFSEIRFARGVALSKLSDYVKMLALWVLLTYFYTTPILEMAVVTWIVVVFALYIKEFKEYAKRYETLSPAIGFADSGSDQQTEIMPYHDPADKELEARILAWTAQENKPFTRPKLTIGDVAKETGIPKHRLSRYVNDKEQNFCSWINRLRVEEAARLLQESRTLTISEIADDTGFCDLPAFSRAFKKIKGVSPRSFRNNG